jgi:hypothetical protein
VQKKGDQGRLDRNFLTHPFKIMAVSREKGPQGVDSWSIEKTGLELPRLSKNGKTQKGENPQKDDKIFQKDLGKHLS